MIEKLKEESGEAFFKIIIIIEAESLQYSCLYINTQTQQGSLKTKLLVISRIYFLVDNLQKFQLLDNYY
ncbi:hypothetical protein MYP_4565 [Sporocytophaga myxococcoides]|uniref:Uncharacterized protein n=1 Tax=Sporocytophaga myxococcoides TaxID=153721 RepID=A0A098LK54_9BACT|nr:hypothetical protein MYP_4565 [Sporocytophaga myxococcoides]